MAMYDFAINGYLQVSFVVSNREAATAPDAVRGGGVGDDAFLSDDISLVNEDERGDNVNVSFIERGEF